MSELNDFTDAVKKLRLEAQRTIEYLRTIDPAEAEFRELIEREKRKLLGARE